MLATAPKTPASTYLRVQIRVKIQIYHVCVEQNGALITSQHKFTEIILHNLSVCEETKCNFLSDQTLLFVQMPTNQPKPWR